MWILTDSWKAGRTAPKRRWREFGVFLYGLGKKVLIANVLGQCVDSIYAMELSEVTGAFAWLAAGMYMLQIYYDFSGYSDMAIGLGKLFGFDFRKTLIYP